MFEYNETLAQEGLIVTETNIRIINYEKNDLVPLTGIHGVDPFFKGGRIGDEKEYPEIELCIVHNVQINSIDIQINLGRTINIKSQFITNDYLLSNGRKLGIAYKILNSQIEIARIFKLKELRCIAIGEKNKIDKYNGYITWAKLGYVMHGKLSLGKFSNLLKEEITLFNNQGITAPSYLNSATLDDLIRSAEGENFWMEKGFSWDAKFELEENSESWKIFIRYKLKRGL